MHCRIKDMETFLHLVETSSFDILSAVRHLVLTYDSEASLTQAHLLRFAPCSRLTTLDITLPWNLSGQPTPMALVPIHVQLTMVGPKFSALTNFSFEFDKCTLRGLLDVLACIPTIQTLSLKGSAIETIEPSALVPSLPQHLRSLHLNIMVGAGLFCTHLLSLPVVPQLRSLWSLEFHCGMHADHWILFAAHRPWAADPAAHDLGYNIWYSFAQQGLQYCTDIRHLTLCLVHKYGNMPASLLTNLLPAPASNNLRSIKIVLLDELSTAEAEALDQTLALPALGNLRSFSCESLESQSLLTPEIRVQMLRASARGILE
ncbi:hypothetical protein B0H10DRAFT_2212569 [Mycena sp. CBHHK59/15]|nr:hypothetical protein B0H10DRAFT_2212569 [Mycena sp. CBHHK59/15]